MVNICPYEKLDNENMQEIWGDGIGGRDWNQNETRVEVTTKLSGKQARDNYNV